MVQPPISSTLPHLSSHLSKFEGTGLVRIYKQFVGKTPDTIVSYTESGRTAVEEHWAQLEKLSKSARNWRKSR